jgi:hypothetical protein
MPNPLNSFGQILEQGSGYVHQGDPNVFLKAFLGNKLSKEDETGSFSLDPRTGSVELQNKHSWGIGFSPVTKTVQGNFRFGGENTSMGRSPEQALDEALGVPQPEIKPTVNDWQDLWRQRNPNYQ